MNGGTVILGDDLSLQAGIFFSGNGVVDLVDKTLIFPSAVSTAWNGNLTFLNANDIRLTGCTKLDSTWTFSGLGLVSRINGAGSILDISGGGELVVGAGHTLYLSDIHVKGLGGSQGNIIVNAEGHLYLSNVTLSLAGSYTLGAGMITVAGNNCMLILNGGQLFTISGSDTVLNVDGVAFVYEQLNPEGPFLSPITTSSGGSVVYANDGVVRPLVLNTLLSGNIFSSTQLFSNMILSPSAWMTFVNEVPSTPKNITLDGQGFFMQFNYTTGQYLTIQENVTLTLKNMLLTDFDPALIKIEGAGTTLGKLIFGDNVMISLGKDITLAGVPLTFRGNAELLGNGLTLTIESGSMLTIDLAGKNLALKNLKLLLNHSSGLQCLHDAASVTLHDSVVRMTGAGANFDRGSLNITNNVSIFGVQTGNSADTSVFTFSSKGFLNVSPGAVLRFEHGTNFMYNPNISSDAGNYALEKRHLLLQDPSATMFLDNCNFSTGSMGFALDYGRLCIDGNTNFHIDPSPTGTVEFGSALLVDVAVEATLNVDGSLIFTETAY
jgi:hypothetical protein